MTWLLPAGLLALLALPVLVILRLAGARRRAHTVGALMLWAEAAHGLPAGSGRRLPPWPLLLLELGACAALGLAVAHPAWVGESPALDVLVVVDRTASMAARGTDGSTAWERGLRALASAMAQHPSATRYTVRAVPPMPGGVLEGPRDAVLAVLRASEPDPDGSGDASDAVGGDFHRSLLVTDRIPSLPGTDRLEVIAAGEPRANLGIARAEVVRAAWSPVEPGNAPTPAVFAVVTNFTHADGDISLQLLRDGTELGRATMQVPAGRAAGVVIRATGGSLDGGVQVRIDHQGDALRSDDVVALERAPSRPLFVAWIGPESAALARAIGAATGRRVVIGDADGDGDGPDLTVCHRTVPQPIPAGPVLVVDPAASVPALHWVMAPNAGTARPSGPHAATFTRLELPARWPRATGYASEPVPRGGSAHATDAGGRPVVWSGTRLGGQPVGVVGFPPDGGWALTPGYPIFWARILGSLIDPGTASRTVERDPAESDLRNAVTADRAGGRSTPTPVAAAALASGRPWLALLAIALLAWRLRRKP